MALKTNKTNKTNKTISSPLVSAFNNIVSISRSGSTIKSTQQSYQGFLRFMDVEIKNIEAIELPKKSKIKSLSNLNVAATFGSAGSLLSSLASGALDVAGLVSNFFGGGKGGKKAGKPSPKAGRAIPKGKGIRFGGVRSLGIISAIFAGLDVAEGLAEGESTSKAVTGAGAALAGSVIGAALGTIGGPLGSIAGGMAGNFVGGWLGDRAHEAITGTGKKDIKSEQKQKLKTQESLQKGGALTSGLTMTSVLDKFEMVIVKFERADPGASGAGNQTSGSSENSFDEPTEYPKIEETPKGGEYSGPVTGDTFFPLPGGKAGQAAAQQYGASRDGGKRSHAGLDMTHHVGALNAQVVAYKTGKVIVASHNGYNGHVTVDHGGGLKTRYYHTTPSVNVGDTVYGGQKIANLYPDGGNTHLHFEMYRGGTPINPSSGGLGQKLPGPLTAEKAKEQAQGRQSSSVTTGGKPTVVLAAGTNDYGDPAKVKANVEKSIKDLQSKGYNVVVVPPNEKGQFAGAHKAVLEAAASSGATVEKGKYNTDDPLHLQMSEASRIKQKFAGAEILGDSNAARIAGGSMSNVAGKRVVGAGTGDILKFAQGMGRVGPQVQPQPQVQVTRQQVQQIQQYPTYNQQQSSTTIVPMLMSTGGGGSQQKPMVISAGGGSGGGETIVLPGSSSSQVLNSLFKTMLLTNLSGT